MSSVQEFDNFEQADAVAPNTKPIQAGSIKKGAYVMLKGHPCKVIEYSTAKPGKHGSAKAAIVGTDIFTGKKHEDSFPTSQTVYVPIVNKVEYEVADVSADGYVSLLLPDFSLKEDLKLPNEQKDELYNLW